MENSTYVEILENLRDDIFTFDNFKENVSKIFSDVDIQLNETDIIDNQVMWKVYWSFEQTSRTGGSIILYAGYFEYNIFKNLLEWGHSCTRSIFEFDTEYIETTDANSVIIDKSQIYDYLKEILEKHLTF